LSNICNYGQTFFRKPTETDLITVPCPMGPGFTGKYLAYTEAKVSGQRKSFIELTQERTLFQLVPRCQRPTL